MKPVKINGFTIVETMLFLGISGLLIMSVLVGTGSSINIQRYHDSVTSLQSYLQQQYSNVANVSNDEMTNACGGGTNRGQSNCVILGKYITIDSSDNKNMQVRNVLGTSCVSSDSNDVIALQNCAIKISPNGAETYNVEWGSSIVGNNKSNLSLSMLILRSPASGLIRTFVSNITTNVVSDSDIGTIINTSNLSQSAKLCVDSNGLFTGNAMAVQVDGNASSASGIESLGENSGC